MVGQQEAWRATYTRHEGITLQVSGLLPEVEILVEGLVEKYDGIS